MARASFMQTSFLGGEFSDLIQGRMESEAYKQGLDLCQNYYPVEEGALLRRQGTTYCGHTYLGKEAAILPFDYSRINPFQLELTHYKLRFWKGASLLSCATPYPIQSVSTTGVVILNGSPLLHFGNRDHVIFDLAPRPDGSCASETLLNRQFKVSSFDDVDTFIIRDVLDPNTALGPGANYVPPTTPNPEGGDFVRKVLELDTPYPVEDIHQVRAAQNEDSVLLLHSKHPPQYVDTLQAATDFLFGIGEASFKDGPYLDLETDATTTVTPSGTTGSITLTLSAATNVNDGDGWADPTDVGRMVRLRTSPAAWAVGTTYAAGDEVTGPDDIVYVSLAASNVGNDPTTNLIKWSVSPTDHVWSWGKITSVTSTTVCTITVDTLSEDLLNTTAINIKEGLRLGLYSDTTGWPTIAGYHEDRLWLAGQTKNRVDGSRVGDKFNFSPTDSNGAVEDSHAVSATAFSTKVNLFRWMITDEEGLVLGTQNGEWRVRASGNDDPITPFSIQMRQVSSYGSAEIDAVQASKAIAFVQRQNRKIMEWKGAATNYTAKNLTLPAEHISATGLKQIAYIQEPTPMLWGRLTDNSLISCSYMSTDETQYNAWAKHPLGNGRVVTSLSSGPSFNTLSDRIYLVTRPSTNLNTDTHWVEFLSDMYDGNINSLCSQFVDSAISPHCMSISGTTLTVSNLWHLVGETVTGAIGGIDIGDHTVTAAGKITVALGAWETGDGDGLTEAYLQGLDTDFGSCAIRMSYTTGTSSWATNTYTVGARAWDDVTTEVDPYDDVSVVIDNERDRLFTISDTEVVSEKGIKMYERSGAGDLIKAFTMSEMQAMPGGSTISEVSHNSGKNFLQDALGRIWFLSAGFNTSMFSGLDPDAETITSIGVADSAQGDPPGNAHMATSHYVDDQGNKRVFLMFTTTLNTPDSQIWEVTPGRRRQAQNFTFAKTDGDTQYCIGTRDPWNGCARFFHINTDNYGLPSTQAQVIHRIDISSDGSGAKAYALASISPTDADAAWTNFAVFAGWFIDETDGNLCVRFLTTDAVTYKTALLKINAETGTIMWRATVPVSSTWGTYIAAQNSHCKRQRYLEYKSGEIIHIWDLSDGSYTTNETYETPAISTIAGGQVSDDWGEDGGQVIFNGTFNVNGSGASMVGTYAEANSSWGAHWMALYANLTNTTAIYDNIETPGTIGLSYTSRAQLLRPDFGNDAGAANGPAFGKVRRIDQFATSLYRTREIKFGTNFDNLRKIRQRTAGGTYVTAPTLMTETVVSALENDYTTEAQICWEQTRPYPGIIRAVGGFISTQDK